MDHIPSLPRSHKGNTELLIWVDLFTGYVIAKGSGSRTAQAIAESFFTFDRPRARITVNDSDRVDFDEILLPEDSWTPDLGQYEFEIEKITDMRSGKRTRYGRIYHEFLVHWFTGEDTKIQAG
ncbi:hypothetical protein PI125_g785 [Phytophthora idaei]|nr:hypothetical protein PI125_g785 [Phytophthora idaei]KAG3146839.1 hypothetical protein PI126_g13139 [Phytophthora idaei]